MIPFESSITIEKPAEQVFRWVADPRNYTRWMNGVTDASAVPGRPAGVGAQVRMGGKFGFWKYRDLLVEVTEFEENRLMGIRIERLGPTSFEGRFSVEPVNGNRTRLKGEGTYKFAGVWGVLEPLLAADVRREEAGELKKIKQILEAGG